MKTVIIYGAGFFGKKLYHALASYGISVSFFCQTNTAKNESCEGIPILSIEEIDQYCRKDTVVFLAITDKTTASNMSKVLLEKGFLPQQIIDTRNYFKYNIVPNVSSSSGRKKCCICKNMVADFLPFGEKTELFSNHRIIGGGYRDSVLCPVCDSMDRERWLYFVLKNETNVFDGVCNVLHIAPEPSVMRMISANPKCDYYAGDIVRGSTMHRIDLTDIPFKNGFFDYVIANHVFEHISDEKKAFGEIRRVLKDSGKFLLSFPICMDMDTFENPKIVSEEERLKYYGQKDHVRLYGKNYKEYIEGFGWQIKVMTPRNCMPEDDILKYGLIADDIIMICTSDKKA